MLRRVGSRVAVAVTMSKACSRTEEQVVAEERLVNGSFSPVGQECALPSDWTACRLERVVPYNHDTSIFLLSTSTKEPLKLPVCSCLLLRAEAVTPEGERELVVRPYTPIAEAGDFEKILPLKDLKKDASFFALMVKRYREWGYDPRNAQFDTPSFRASYRPPGLASNYIFSEPETIDLKHVDSCRKLQYPFEKEVELINMIAVGAGIAPMIQALTKILFTKNDKTKVVLFYGNRSVEDILLKETLDYWASDLFKDRLKVVYCVGSRYANVHSGLKKQVKDTGFSTTYDALSKPPELPLYDSLPVSKSQAKEPGWVGKDAIQKHAFPPNHNTRTFVCGLPKVYLKLCGPRADPNCTGILRDLGYQTKHVVKF